MNNCKCGMTIGLMDKYCTRCEDNLNLQDKVIENIRKDTGIFPESIYKIMEPTV